MRSQRQALAMELMRNERYDLALELWEANVADGGQTAGGYGWLHHAATVWHLTQARERSLALLQRARDDDDRNFIRNVGIERLTRYMVTVHDKVSVA